MDTPTAVPVPVSCFHLSVKKRGSIETMCKSIETCDCGLIQKNFDRRFYFIKIEGDEYLYRIISINKRYKRVFDLILEKTSYTNTTNTETLGIYFHIQFVKKRLPKQSKGYINKPRHLRKRQ